MYWNMRLSYIKAGAAVLIFDDGECVDVWETQQADKMGQLVAGSLYFDDQMQTSLKPCNSMTMTHPYAPLWSDHQIH